MQTLLQDLSYGWRMLRKSPGLTSVILIMLTLGIGATTMVFTIFEAILLRPLAYEKPEELVQIWETRTDGSFQQSEFSYPDYLDVKRENKVFSQIGGYSRNSVTLSSKDGAEQLQVAVATPGFFETLGVQPILGRTFGPGEDELQKDFPVMLSYGAWQRRFGGNPGVVGTALALDGELATVVGVLPKNFAFAPTQSAELWMSPRVSGFFLRRNAYWLHPLARLKPGEGNTSRFDLEGHPKSSGGQEYEANTPTVTQNYFSVMGIPLRAGRFFNSQDRDQSVHVVIVNQAMADMVFPRQDPIGKRINFTYTNEPQYVQIVGVVGNENVDSLEAPPTPIVYDCYEQDPCPYFSLVIRTRKEPATLVAAVTRSIQELEPQAPVFKISSMAQIISTSPTMMVRAYPAYLIGGFSAVALLLATLGLYGVLAYSVEQRSRELGLRMALGAQRGDLLRMVVNSGLKLALIGIALGIVGGVVTSRLIASLLFGVSPTDAATLAGVCVVLFVAAMVASYVPARRATTVDPMVALRCE